MCITVMAKLFPRTELYFVPHPNSYAATNYVWPIHEQQETQENPVYCFAAG